MVVRKKAGALTSYEQQIVKALVAHEWRNQDIQNLINKGRSATINAGRISEVKDSDYINPVSEEELDFYITKKNSYDPQTGLNFYDDERLIRAREAMNMAVQTFNNPSIQFKTEVFAVQAHIAWTYLLHEYYRQQGIDFTDKDGSTLPLSRMVKRHDCPISHGIQYNLEDLITIRDNVEHKLLRKADNKFFPKFQACCLNFDTKLCDLFGQQLSLQKELSLALQFAKLDFEQIQTLHEYDIPEEIEALDAQLDDRLSDEQKQDLEYQFRVIYTLQASSKSQSHIRFIRPDSKEGKTIHNVLAKRVMADEMYPYKPSDVWKEVARRTGRKFNRDTHTRAMYMYGARPPKNSKQPENTVKKWCVYHPVHNSYTYSQEWIDYLVECVSDDNEYEKIRTYTRQSRC